MRVTQINQVELEVPDRYAAASWYQTVLEFEICRDTSRGQNGRDELPLVRDANLTW
jgi:catechol-2,3-dioxygenase